MATTVRRDEDDALANISKRIEELGDWRGETLANARSFSKQTPTLWSSGNGSSPPVQAFQSGPTMAAFVRAKCTNRLSN